MNNFVDKATKITRLIDPEAELNPTATLVIGDVMRWKRMRRELPVIRGFVFADIEDLTLEMLQRVEPQIILSPLLARDFDAIEIARRLNEVGYLGRYRVVTDRLPKPEVIIRDVRAVAPNLDFAILDLPSIR